MTSQQHYIKNAVKMPLTVLKTKLEKGRAGKADEADPVILDIRELTMEFGNASATVRRVFIDTADAATLASVGWIIDEGAEYCFNCSAKFSMFVRKHHCRTCGNVACHVCCASLTYIQNYEELGSQRICNKCNPMNSKKVRLASNMSWGHSLYGEGLSLTHPDKTSATTPTYNNPHAGSSTGRASSTSGRTSLFANLASHVSTAAYMMNSVAQNAASHVTTNNSTNNSNPNATTTPGPSAAEIVAQQNAEAAALRRAKLIKRKQKEDAASIERATTAAAAAPEKLTVTPLPGYVIKSRRTVIDENKIFINVFHHTCIVDEELMLTFIPYEPEPEVDHTSPATTTPNHTSDNTTGTFGAELSPSSELTTTPAPANQVKLKPLIYISAPSSTEDREGYVSLLYNVLVSSTYFQSDVVREQSVHITHPSSVNKIIQAINHRYKDSIAVDSFVLPKAKSRYHGPPFTQPAVFSKIDCTVVYTDAKLLKCGSSSTKYRSDEGSVVSGSGKYGHSGSMSASVNGTANTATAPGVKIMTKPPRPLRRVSSNTNNYTLTSLSTHSHHRSAHNNDDTESIVSDMTQQSNFTDHDMSHIREHRRYSLFASRRVDGVNSVTEEMLRLNAAKSIRWEESQQLKQASIVYANTLLGYQIILPYNAEMEAQFNKGRNMPFIDPSFIYVIVDMAKNNMRKTEYKITNHITGDAWVRLKRGQGKSGIEFRLLRKVIDVTTTVSEQDD